MRFSNDGVDLPEPLLDSFEADRLVIFAGAGVSARAYPGQKAGTYFPLFLGLVENVAARLGISVDASIRSRLKAGQADKVLGDWESDGYPVKQTVAEILTSSTEGSRTVVHEAIVRLAATRPNPRVVTTNFDDLLNRGIEAAVRPSNQNWPTYTAPALPPGNRFRGLCYLHGRAADPSDLVLTDTDIGRAYMQEGWALRFAHALFSHFDTLFVGYSLEDPPLRYLSLALEGTQTHRWTLVPEPSNPSERLRQEADWMRRRCRVIWYPVHRRDHRSVERNLGAWAADIESSFRSVRSFLSPLAADDPDVLAPHVKDRAIRALSDQEQLRDFMRANPVPSWLPVLVSENLVPAVFEGNENLSVGDWETLRWIARGLVTEFRAWATRLVTHREMLPTSLLAMVGRELHCCRHEEAPADACSSDLPLLLEFLSPQLRHATRHDLFVAKELLDALLEQGANEVAIWLLMRLSEARTTFSTYPRFFEDMVEEEGDASGRGNDESLSADVGFPPGAYAGALCDLVTDVLIPRINGDIRKLAEELIRAIEDLKGLRGRLGHRVGGILERQSISALSKTQVRRPETFLLFATRETLNALVSADPVMAEGLIRSLIGHENVFLRRLASYGGLRLIEIGHVEW